MTLGPSRDSLRLAPGGENRSSFDTRLCRREDSSTAPAGAAMCQGDDGTTRFVRQISAMLPCVLRRSPKFQGPPGRPASPVACPGGAQAAPRCRTGAGLGIDAFAAPPGRVHHAGDLDYAARPGTQNRSRSPQRPSGRRCRTRSLRWTASGRAPSAIRAGTTATDRPIAAGACEAASRSASLSCRCTPRGHCRDHARVPGR